jgi:hypothetical protein
MRADKVGKDTLLAQIVTLISAAQRSQPPIQPNSACAGRGGSDEPQFRVGDGQCVATSGDEAFDDIPAAILSAGAMTAGRFSNLWLDAVARRYICYGV